MHILIVKGEEGKNEREKMSTSQREVKASFLGKKTEEKHALSTYPLQ